MTAYRLDVPELQRRLDAQRQARGLSWRGVGRETGLNPSTFSRITQGHPIQGDALLTLVLWLGLGTDLGPLIETGTDPIGCPTCQRPYQPNRDGRIRRHDCQPDGAAA